MSAIEVAERDVWTFSAIDKMVWASCALVAAEFNGGGKPANSSGYLTDYYSGRRPCACASKSANRTT